MKSLPQRVGLATGALGVAVLIGWLLDIGILKSVFPGLPYMTPNTALCFVLLGSALAGSPVGLVPPSGRVKAAAAIAGAVSALSLLQHVSGLDIGFDQLLHRAPEVSNPYPGRMALATSVGLTLAAASALVQHRFRFVALSLSLAVLAVGFTSTLGYLIREEALYTWQTFSSAALHAALGLILLGAGGVSAALGIEDRISDERRIAGRATVLVVVAAISTSAVSLFSAEMHQSIGLSASMRTVVAARAEHFQLGIENRHTRATIFSSLPELARAMRASLGSPSGSAAARPQLDRIVNAFREHGFSSIRVEDPGGRILSASGSPFFESPDATVLDIRPGAKFIWKQGLTLYAEFPIKDGIGPLGTVRTEQPLEELSAALKRPESFGGKSRLSICALGSGSAARCIPGLPVSLTALLQNEINTTRNGRNGPLGLTSVPDESGRPLVSGYQAVKQTGLTVLVTTPAGDIPPAVWQQLRITALLILASAVLGYFLIKAWVRPIAASLEARVAERTRLLEETAASLREKDALQANSNQLLEQTVEARTRELEQANQRLDQERSRLVLSLEGSRISAWEADIPTKQVWQSAEWHRMVGESADTEFSTFRELVDRVPEWDRQRALAAMQNVLDGHSKYYDVEHAVRRNDGSLFWIRSRGQVTQRDEAGHPLKMSGTNSDITRRKLAEQELVHSEQKLRLVADNLPIMINFIDTAGKFLFANKLYYEFLGLADIDLVGRDLRDVAGPDAAIMALSHLDRLAKGDTVAYFRERKDKSGATRSLEIRQLPFRNESQELVGIFCLIEDITDRKAAQQALVESEAQLAAITSNLPIGICQVDAAGTVLFANRYYHELFRRQPGTLLGSNIYELVNQSDRASLESRLPALRAGTEVRYERTVSLPARGDTVLEIRLVPRMDSAGRLKTVYALIEDITSRRDAERMLKQSESQLRQLAENLPVAVVEIMLDGTLLYANRQYRTMFQMEGTRDLTGMLCRGAQPETLAKLNAKLQEASANEQIRFECEVSPDPDTTLLLEVTLIPRADSRGQIASCYAMLNDVTRRKLAEQALRQQALTDSLTGLPNRRLLTDRINMAIAKAQRSHGTFAVLYLDLDGFKPVNDHFGHGAGDDLLRTIGTRLAAAVRGSDTVSRVGGDEFVVLLTPCESAESALAVGNKLIEVISTPIQLSQGEAQVSCSVGVSLYPDDATEATDLLDLADGGLLRAKQAGKAQVVLASWDTRPDPAASLTPGIPPGRANE